MDRNEAEALTPEFVKLGASIYGSTSWPVRLFNPIIAVNEDKTPQLLWDTDASGAKISSYKDVNFKKTDGHVYRTFELEGTPKQIRCLTDYDFRSDDKRNPYAKYTYSQFHAHTEMGALGVRKSFPSPKDPGYQGAVRKLLSNYDLKAPFDKEGVVSSDWFNLLRALPLEEMGMSTNLLRANVPAVEGPKMYKLSLKKFLAKHPFGEAQPLVADWDYGPEGLDKICKSEKVDGAAAAMCIKYGGPPARDPYHVDLKLNPIWIVKNKPWKKFGSPDGNWYKDTLDQKLKEDRDLWKPA
jgi:hypothetical protein